MDWITYTKPTHRVTFINVAIDLFKVIDYKLYQAMVASYVFTITIASLSASSMEDANVCRARRCSIEGGEKSEDTETYNFFYGRKGINAPISAELPVPTSVENRLCSSNVGMTDTLRTQFLDMHNYRRSLLALGKVKKDDGTYLLPATNMLQLRYDCALEAAAFVYASKCPSHKSDDETKKDEGENFYKIPVDGLANFEDGAKAAVLAWWDAYHNYPGVAESTLFRTDYLGSKVTSFTQMAWAKSRKLGCSIVKCLSNYIVICRYSPRVDFIPVSFGHLTNRFVSYELAAENRKDISFPHVTHITMNKTSANGHVRHLYAIGLLRKVGLSTSDSEEGDLQLSASQHLVVTILGCGSQTQALCVVFEDDSRHTVKT